MTMLPRSDAPDRARHGRWLGALRGSWPLAVCRLLERREPAVVRVLVAGVRGSSPREPGACMLVSRAGIHGTIGGGNLEWQAMQAAQSLLCATTHTSSVALRRLVLGRELGQCCGGVVQLWLERFTPLDLPLLRRAAALASAGGCTAIISELSGEGIVRRRLETGSAGGHPLMQLAANGEKTILIETLAAAHAVLWLYGAGHVGQALIRVLAELPFEVTWIDSRAELLPEGLADNVHPLCRQAPVNTVPLAPAAARFLVMTHDHALDYALCRAILERGDFAWLGLIGSKSKGARFRSRLARDGLTPEAIGRLVCPIGVEGIDSKWPAAIAVGVAAQLLRSPELSPGASSRALPARSTPPDPAEICPPGGCAACTSPAP
jgi:xanthine dehydrogenase accessory factor